MGLDFSRVSPYMDRAKSLCSDFDAVMTKLPYAGRVYSFGFHTVPSNLRNLFSTLQYSVVTRDVSVPKQWFSKHKVAVGGTALALILLSVVRGHYRTPTKREDDV